MSLLSRRNAITIPLVVVLVIASTGRCGLAQVEAKETHAEAPSQVPRPEERRRMGRGVHPPQRGVEGHAARCHSRPLP